MLRKKNTKFLSVCGSASRLPNTAPLIADFSLRASAHISLHKYRRYTSLKALQHLNSDPLPDKYHQHFRQGLHPVSQWMKFKVKLLLFHRASNRKFLTPDSILEQAMRRCGFGKDTKRLFSDGASSKPIVATLLDERLANRT